MEDTPRAVHALDYLNVFRRRKWWLVVPIVLSIVVGLLLLKVLPKEYRSTATLAVAAPVVSPSLVNQSMQDNQERMRALSQQMLTAPILSRVIQEEGLGKATDDRLIGRLRNSINIAVPDPVAQVNEPRRLDAFLVSYGDPDPGLAQRVTNRVV
jgi:succinoglycan biosynthesis transport protein ExoP